MVQSIIQISSSIIFFTYNLFLDIKKSIVPNLLLHFPFVAEKIFLKVQIWDRQIMGDGWGNTAMIIVQTPHSI